MAAFGNFSGDQIAEFMEAFQLFDNVGDNKIYVSQIGEALRALGQNPTESEVRKLTSQHKNDDRIGFDSFISIYLSLMKNGTETDLDVLEILRHFDKDGNGFISFAELRHLLTTLGEKLTDVEVELLLSGHKDDQGNVNYENLVNTLMSMWIKVDLQFSKFIVMAI